MREVADEAVALGDDPVVALVFLDVFYHEAAAVEHVQDGVLQTAVYFGGLQGEHEHVLVATGDVLAEEQAVQFGGRVREQKLLHVDSCGKAEIVKD